MDNKTSFIITEIIQITVVAVCVCVCVCQRDQCVVLEEMQQITNQQTSSCCRLNAKMCVRVDTVE